MPLQREPHVANVANNRLHYYGGRVLAKPQIVQVLWGAGVSAELATGMAAFYRSTLQSPYMDWLGEYDTINVATNLRLGTGTTTETKQKIGRGTFVATVQITPSNPSTNLADAEVMTELAHQIDAGVLPPPADDGKGGYRTLYMIDFPAGTQITAPLGEQSCVQFCAFHSAGVYKGKNLPYGVHPDLTQSGCAGNCGNAATSLGNATSVHSHELIEAITDPDLPILLINGGMVIDAPVAWFDDGGGGEIGDICNGQQAMLDTFTVQTEYSNSQGTCLTTVPGLPVCVDAVGGGCSACMSSAQCSGATPICATDPADIKNGECVHCADGTACAGATPVCDKSGTEADDTCRGCTASTECAAPTPVCATTATGTITSGSCVECLVSPDCTNAKPVCNASAGACMGCTSDSECTDPANPSCDTSAGSCGPDTGGCGCSSRGPISGGDLGLVGGALVGLGLILRRRTARRVDRGETAT
jgi:hypothetical protein